MLILVPVVSIFLLVYLYWRGLLEKKYLLPLVLLCGIGLVLLLQDQLASGEEISSLDRNEAGGGSRTAEVEVETGQGERIPLSLEIPEQTLTASQAEEALTTLCGQLEERILGENSSLNRVSSPLLLETSYENGITAEWMSDKPEILDWTGALGEEIPSEGETVTISARLQLQEAETLYERKITVFPGDGEDSTEARVRKLVETQNADTSVREYQLPAQLDGETLQWFPRAENSGLVISLLSLVAAVLAILSARQRAEQEETRRREKLEREYPDFVAKLQLFMGAGLNIRRAFLRLSEEYQRSGAGKGGKQFYLEEAAKTCTEMQNGIPEADAYRRMGIRCGTASYKTLGLLLGRSLKKGDGELVSLLEQEASAAYENRKRKARLTGEKNALRLLIPMFMMLAVVMILIIVPAFLSF